MYKLFIKERKTQCKLKEKHKKYPSLFIENKSRNKGTIKKPTIQTTKQIKVNNVQHTNVEKSKDNHIFDNLLSNVHPKRKEDLIQNMNLKPTKSVRFNDGIEVHSVSPSQPLYKLKPLGRLFDEPSAVRSVDTPSCSEQELEERIEDSDSEFDADTGITSEGEDSDIETSSHIEDHNNNTEITENEKVGENSLQATKTKIIYDFYEDDSQSTDHEISKEGNDLILSSKMMTVVQGKWVKETKQIISNTYHTKDTIMSNKKSNNEDVDEETQEFSLVRSIEHILENIKNLCISNPEKNNTSSDTISSIDRDESEANLNNENEHLVVGNIKVGQDHTDIEIRIQKKVCVKNINSKISLENDLSKHLIDEKLLNIENNKLSYDHDIYDIKSNMEEKLEERIRSKPIKLVDDLIEYINDWNSSNSRSSLNHNASQTSSTESVHKNDPGKDKYIKQKEITEVQNMVDDEGSSEYPLIEKNIGLNEEEDNSKDLSHEEESNLDKKDNLKNLYEKENSCLDEQNYFPLLSVNNNQEFKPNTSFKTTNKSIEMIKTEPSFSSDILRSTEVGKTGYETHDYLPNSNIKLSKINEVSEEKEFQINETFKGIRSMVCNQSTSNPNELYSTFCSLITKPILDQPLYVEGESGDQDDYNEYKSFEREELDQEKKKIHSGYSVSAQNLNSEHHTNGKTQETVKGDNEIQEEVNMGPNEENNLKENTQIMFGPKLTKNSVMAGQQRDKESGDYISKISVKEKKLFFDESENIHSDKGKTKIFEGHIAVESETNFMSKVQGWSSNCKKYSEDVTMTSQTSSILANCNTDSFQKKVFDMEDLNKITEDHNNEFYSNLSNEDSFGSRSNEDNNIFEESNNSGIDLDTASSGRSVAPVKWEKTNCEEVSTAYETDPETGKLVMNHFLHPLSNSTPIKLEQIQEQQESVPKRRPSENSLDDLSTYSSKEYKDNQYLQSQINNQQCLGTTVIEESTIKSTSQSKNNIPTELSSNVNLLVTYDERKNTETNEVLGNGEKQRDVSKKEIKNWELNDLTETLIEKQSEALSGTNKPPFQQSNKKSSSESIIENSENDSLKVTEGRKKNIDKVKTILSPPICTEKQQDQESYIQPKEISITSDIQNCNTFTINKTLGSSSEQKKSNEATYGSLKQSNKLRASKKTVELNQRKNSHSSDDILYDTLSVSDDNKFGQYIKTSTIGLEMAVEEYNISESENLINENIGGKFITKHHKKRLSTVSESIINNNSRVDGKFTSGSNENVESRNNIFNSNQMEALRSHSALTDKKSSSNSTHGDLKNKGETTDLVLGNHDTFSKNILNNRQANVSHVTFLIRNPLSPEGKSCITESGYQQLTNLSQSASASKMKQHGQNKEINTNEILSTTTKIQTAEDTNHSHAQNLKVPHSNLPILHNNGSHFSLGVENSHIESSIMPSHNDQHKYFAKSSTYLRLKRKLEEITENDSGSEISPSQHKLITKKVKINDSGNKHSTVVQYSESPVTTDTSSIEMNLKRVNTDIRRKRAKLKKENPVRKSSTSSSEDEVKKPSLLKVKSLESSKLLVHKLTESNKFDLGDKTDSVDLREQNSRGRSDTDQKDYDSKKISSLTLSFENKAMNESFDHKILNSQKETEYNQLSDSSSSIIYSSPNRTTALQLHNITKTNDKSKIHFDIIKKRHAEDESQYFSGNVNSAKKRNEKSHKSYSLYRKYDNFNKENSNIPFKGSRPNNEYPKKPLKQSNPGLDSQKDRNNEAKNPNQSIKKNRKSSIVGLMGTAEANQISNSPEVKGLLRRTYFMGNN